MNTKEETVYICRLGSRYVSGYRYNPRIFSDGASITTEESLLKAVFVDETTASELKKLFGTQATPITFRAGEKK